jgi:hypothetical protein
LSAEAHAYIAEMREYTPELPNVTFDQRLVLHGRAHDLHLMWRGRGHTAGDVIVFCPAKRVLASDDRLHCTLTSTHELESDQVIGGHGDVQHGRERLGQMAAYIAELAEAVAQGKERGCTVEQYDGGFALDTPAAALAKGLKENIASTWKALERS